MWEIQLSGSAKLRWLNEISHLTNKKLQFKSIKFDFQMKKKFQFNTFVFNLGEKIFDLK